MLKRLYVDNYKCLVNFQMGFEDIQILLGDNGSGKSCIFEVIHFLQTLVRGGRQASELIGTLTRWETRSAQRFEIDLFIEDQYLTYELTIEHSVELRKARIQKERVHVAGQNLFLFEDGQVHLYRDDFSPGPIFSFDWLMSGLNAVTERGDNRRLSQLKRILCNQWLVVQIEAKQIGSLTRGELTFPSSDMSDFVSWLHFLSNEHQDLYLEMLGELKHVLPEFRAFKFVAVGEGVKSLRAQFGKDKLEYRFDELSTGQRCLIILTTLLHCTQPSCLFLDEPENYLALPEVQPWLMALKEKCENGELQAVIISHHPEFINLLASSRGFWLERSANGPANVKTISTQGDFPAAELVARGWLT